MTDNKNSLGMDQKTASWFAYVLSWLSAVILLATEKDNKVVRQHAWQSLFLGIVIFAVYFLLMILSGMFLFIAPFLIVLFSVLTTIAWIGWLVLTVICIIKATQNDMFEIPVIYGWVEKMKS